LDKTNKGGQHSFKPRWWYACLYKNIILSWDEWSFWI